MIGLGLFNGLVVTMKAAIRGPVTVQYPDRRVGLLGAAREVGLSPFQFLIKRPKDAVKAAAGFATVEDKVKQAPRFRGQDFNWYEERCTGCASCAKFCPLGIIKIETSPSATLESEGEVYNIDVFDIDIGRCMFCGICVEVCPYDALHMGSGFESGQYERKDLVITVDELKAKKKTPSTWFRPQMEAAGYDPHSGEDRPWDDAGRHEQPGDEKLTERWVNDR
jgi:formate hydrogenlyase subunit 6/NADH:ubiquinone oxidoreductase subunit I